MDNKPTDKQIEEAALQAVTNFGAPQDLYVESHGWIMRGGKVTDEGRAWYKENKHELEKDREGYVAGKK